VKGCWCSGEGTYRLARLAGDAQVVGAILKDIGAGLEGGAQLGQRRRLREPEANLSRAQSQYIKCSV
jgi:hypothetical protein